MLNKNKDNKSKIILIAGPTASGKSLLALDLAKKYKGVIINADSQQIYKELPILSSQPSKNDFKEISHKLFGFLNFHNSFSVAEWFNLVKKEIKLILGKNKLPIVVGGTGMYINALLNGLKIFPDIPKKKKEEGKKIIKSIGSKNFYKMLKEKDKLCVHNINPNDKTRLLRSWEIFQASGKSIYEINKKNKIKKLKHVNFCKILIFPSRKEAYINCAERWDKMIKLGAIDEVKSLINKEKKLNKMSLIKTIGFNEIKKFLFNNEHIDKVSNQALQATRNYAKRQYTWFRNQYKADITFFEKYDQQKKKFFFKEIHDKLLTN